MTISQGISGLTVTTPTAAASGPSHATLATIAELDRDLAALTGGGGGPAATRNRAPALRMLGSAAASGPLTHEGLFLLMAELMTAQNGMLKAKTEQFKAQIQLQEKYAEFRNMAMKAHAAARSGMEGSDAAAPALTMAQLREMGFTAEQLAVFEGHATDGRLHVDNFCNAMNEILFGTDTSLHVGTSMRGFPAMDQFDSFLTAIDTAKDANTADTMLLTTELSEAVNSINRLSSMFTNMLSKLHETEMGIINNIR